MTRSGPLSRVNGVTHHIADSVRIGVEAGLVRPGRDRLPHQLVQPARDPGEDGLVQPGMRDQVTLVGQEPALPRGELPSVH